MTLPQKVKSKIVEGIDSIGPMGWGFVNKALNRNIILGFILLLLFAVVYQDRKYDIASAACAAENKRLNEKIEATLREMQANYIRDFKEMNSIKKEIK